MKKLTFIFLTLFFLSLTACVSASRSNSANPASVAQNGTAAGELPVTTQIALGTMKLDDTDLAITAEQATKLLPLWETLQVLYNSDTAAKQEIEALSTQIQETMTDEQMQAITAMSLTRQEMFSIMQAQGAGVGNGRQNNNSQQSGNSSNNRGSGQGGFGPGAGGPPPDERGFAGGPGFGGGGQGQNLSAEQVATAQAARQAGNGNRIPTPLVNALIEFLKKKAGS
jgi:hypothetical protein